MRIIRAFSILLFVGGTSVFLTVLWPAYRSGTRLLSVQSNSMEPVFASGDAVIMRPAGMKNLELDTVISYRSASDPKVIISHRLIDVDYENGVLYTQGDNAEFVDDEVASSQIVGTVTQVIPRLGHVIDFLSKPLGLLLAIYIPGFLILFTEARRAMRRYSHPVYQHQGYENLKKHRQRVMKFIDKKYSRAHNQNIILRRAVR